MKLADLRKLAIRRKLKIRFALRNGMRSSGDVGPAHGFVEQSPLKQPIEVGFVNPAHALPAGADSAPQSQAS